MMFSFIITISDVQHFVIDVAGVKAVLNIKEMIMKHKISKPYMSQNNLYDIFDYFFKCKNRCIYFSSVPKQAHYCMVYCLALN